MPKIVVVKKKDVFPGRKGTSWSRTSLVREGMEVHLHARMYACHTSGGRYPGARRAVVQPCSNADGSRFHYLPDLNRVSTCI